MKAIQIMLFLLFFNLAISMVSMTHIYNIGDFQNEPEPFDNEGLWDDSYDNTEVETDFDINTSSSIPALMATYMFSIFVGLAIGMMAGIVGWKFGGVPGDSAFLYGMFAGTFWAFTIQTALVFSSIMAMNLGFAIVISVFLMVCGIIFVIGFAQLIKGGFAAMM